MYRFLHSICRCAHLTRGSNFRAINEMATTDGVYAEIQKQKHKCLCIVIDFDKLEVATNMTTMRVTVICTRIMPGASECESKCVCFLFLRCYLYNYIGLDAEKVCWECVIITLHVKDLQRVQT